MSTTLRTVWPEANQRYLAAALDGVRAALERHASGHGPAGAPDRAEELAAARAAVPGTPALDTVCAAFGLTPFERDLLLLCAGVELDARFADLCAAAQGIPERAYPTFGLALAALADAHWSALTPARPLRRWLLLEFDPHGPVTTGRVRIDERILHYLAGVDHTDERLRGLVEADVHHDGLLPSEQAVADRAAPAWRETPGAFPVVELRGADRMSCRAVATAVAGMLGLGLCAVDARRAPECPTELDVLVRLLEREAALSGSAVLVEGGGPVGSALVDRLTVPTVVAGHTRGELVRRRALAFDVPRPTAREQGEVWRTALAASGATANGEVDALTAQFALTASAIRHACAVLDAADGAEPLKRAWDACRMVCRQPLDGLAQRIEPSATWHDLVLPAAQRELLDEIALHLAHRTRVYDTWGFAARSPRGLGISALFAGPSGTGKTMAAEVLADAARLDLYRVDLSQVVSKYIGETEKNLSRVFDAAEAGGAILLFDEADALFGKRTEVKDSHDRYANIEVSYLLQRMEAYRGLAILTTNLKDALDPAFMRRIRFVVHFPFPDEAQRAEIWRRVFPDDTPTEGLDVRRLATLNVAGGTIRNIALRAAFLAAAEHAPVRMPHLARAARGEFAKLERPLSAADVGGWR